MRAFYLNLFLLTWSVASAGRTIGNLPILYVAHETRGILTFSFDSSKAATASLQLLDETPAGFQPGWLHIRDDLIYSVSRTHFRDNSSSDGGVFSFQRNGKGASGRNTASDAVSLSLLSSTSSRGDGGVFCDISKDGKTLSVADIDGSTIAVYPLLSPGHIGDPTYVIKYNLTHPGPGAGDSQLQSNPHQTAFDPSGRYMVVPDRGADFVYIYQVDSPSSVKQVQNITMLPGTGPRHVTFKIYNQTRTFMYLVSEIDNTVNVFALDGVDNSGCESRPRLASRRQQQLSVTHIQMVSSLGAGSNRTAPDNKKLASEVAISYDGKFAYVTNRNTLSYDSDTISIYSVHPAEDEHLVFIGQNLTYAKIPRHFSLSKDKDNRYLGIGNQYSNLLVILERDTMSGFVKRLAGNYSLGEFNRDGLSGPMAVMWT